MNVAGQRLSTAEVEAALLAHCMVSEAAVVGIEDEISGQAVVAFVSLKSNATKDVRKALLKQVGKSIGKFALPRAVYVVDDLPKTRSGKITRRILRKILTGDTNTIGDTSTLVNPSAINEIVKVVQKLKK